MVQKHVNRFWSQTNMFDQKSIYLFLINDNLIIIVFFLELVYSLNEFIYFISWIFIFKIILILLHNLKIDPSIYVLLLKNFFIELLFILYIILLFNWIYFHQFLKISLFNLISKCILLVFLIFIENALVHLDLIFRLVITTFIIKFLQFISFYFVIISINVVFLLFFIFKLTFKVLFIELFILLIYAPKNIS